MICPYDEQQCEYRDGGPGSCIRSSSGPSFDMQCYQNWRKDKGGSPSPEAEVLLKGQPHEAEEHAENMATHPSTESARTTGTRGAEAYVEKNVNVGAIHSEVGGSDTARLQQHDADVFALARSLIRPYPASYRVFCAALDAQAIALRTAIKDI